MKITITEYQRMAKDENGRDVPVGDNYLAHQTLTAVGAATALNAATRLIRLATDTAVTVDVASAGASSELLPANAVEYFKVSGGQVLTFAAV